MKKTDMIIIILVVQGSMVHATKFNSQFFKIYIANKFDATKKINFFGTKKNVFRFYFTYTRCSMNFKLQQTKLDCVYLAQQKNMGITRSTRQLVIEMGQLTYEQHSHMHTFIQFYLIHIA